MFIPVYNIRAHAHTHTHTHTHTRTHTQTTVFSHGFICIDNCLNAKHTHTHTKYSLLEDTKFKLEIANEKKKILKLSSNTGAG